MKIQRRICTILCMVGLLVPVMLPGRSPFGQNNPLQDIPLQSPSPLQQATQSNHNAKEVILLGQNRNAKIGAWVSLCLVTLLSVTTLYKTCQGCFDSIMAQMPFFKSYQASTVRAASIAVTTPASLIGLMKFGPIVWYTTYMVYAGERVSPLLARSVLHDIQVYIQHLNTVKSVEKDLRAAIDQINQMVGTQTAAADIVTVENIDASKSRNSAYIDPVVLDQIYVLIQQDEARIQQILEQLQAYLPADEIAQFTQSIDMHKSIAYSIASDLLEQAQAIIERLKLFNNDLGADAAVLSNLIQELIKYWQKYTQGLADSIDVDLHFCNEIHALEQFIVNWLDRSLLCV